MSISGCSNKESPISLSVYFRSGGVLFRRHLFLLRRRASDPQPSFAPLTSWHPVFPSQLEEAEADGVRLTDSERAALAVVRERAAELSSTEPRCDSLHPEGL